MRFRTYGRIIFKRDVREGELNSVASQKGFNECVHEISHFTVGKTEAS
jgi:hypothetical protein